MIRSVAAQMAVARAGALSCVALVWAARLGGRTRDHASVLQAQDGTSGGRAWTPIVAALTQTLASALPALASESDASAQIPTSDHRAQIPTSEHPAQIPFSGRRARVPDAAARYQTLASGALGVAKKAAAPGVK